MSMVKELLNGGLVTARDPSLLIEGELQQANDMVLKPYNPAVHRAPGRTAYGTVLASAAVSCDTTSGSPRLVTTTSNFTTAFVGQTLSGTGITGGTTVAAVIARTQSIIAGVVISGGTTMTAAAGTTFGNLFTGQLVTGSGIPTGTTITVVSRTTITLSQASTNATITATFHPTLTMSANATGTATVSVTFGAGTKVKGLAHLSFDQGNDRIIAYLGNNLYSSAFTTLTGTFSSLLSDLKDVGNEKLTTLHYNNAHYVLTNLNKPKRISYTQQPNADPVLSARTMGMEPVGLSSSLSSTSFAVATTTGTWPVAGLGFGTGTYWFLITEVYKPGEPDSVESSFIPYNDDGSTNLKSLDISSLAVGVLVTRHDPLINDGTEGRNLATHWSVYIAGPFADAAVKPSITQFKRLGDAISISATSYTYTSNSATRGASASGTSGFPGAVAAFGAVPQFTNAANFIGRADNKWAIADGGNHANILRTYGLTGSGTTVTGIEVVLTGVCAAGNDGPAPGALVGLSSDNGATVKGGDTNYKEYRFDSPGGVAGVQRIGGLYLGSIKKGGQGDLWGTTWTTGNLADGSFAVIVRKIGTVDTDNLAIDTISVKVYLDGGTVVTKDVFRSVVVQDELGIVVAFGADMPPPRASTGDVYEGQVVLNNLDNRREIRYSIPDGPESFPQPYVVAFQSNKRDEVTFIRRVGPILVIGMSTSIKRMNYLPREDDAQFDRGRAFEDITIRNGIPSETCGVVFDMGTGPLLAYVSATGLRVTDGVTDRSLNEDLDWLNTVEQSLLSQAILRDDVENFALELYYTPAGGTANTKKIQFSYHPMHRKASGMLPAMGPTTVNARAAASGELGIVPVLLTGHGTDGVVYVENQGTSDASGGTIAPILLTRLIYLGDVGQKTRVKRIYTRVSADGTTSTVTGTTVVGSAAVTSAAQFGAVTVGMVVESAGLLSPGTKVTAVTDSSNITVSQNAIASGTGSLTFNTGAIELTLRKQNVDEVITDLLTIITDTVTGGLLRTHLDHQAEAHQLEIVKVATVNADLAVHYVGFDVVPHGKEQGTR